MPTAKRDTSFNAFTDATVSDIVLQRDGKIVVIFFEVPANPKVNGEARTGVARLNPDGTLDASFNPNILGPVRAVALQPDDKLLVGGSLVRVDDMPRTYVARFNADGTLDDDFKPFQRIPIFGMAVQPDGKILLGLNSGVERFNADGTLDTTFSASVFGGVNALAVQSDGKIVIAGTFNNVSQTPQGKVARLNSDGSLDTSFAPKVADANLHTVALQPDGKILIGGILRGVDGAARNNLARLNADGTLDAGFDANLEITSTVRKVVVQPNGKILIGGTGGTGDGDGLVKSEGHYNGIGLVRLNADGTLDEGFDPEIGTGHVYTLALQPDGKLLVGGLNGIVKGSDFVVGMNNIARLDVPLN